MTAPNKNDVMGVPLNDYDIVWMANGDGLYLACIKAVTVPFTRVNPAWHYSRSATSIPRHITGTEDKILFVMNHGPTDLNNSTPSMGTTRRFGCSGTVRVDDPYILNSNLAEALREKTRKTKK